MSRSTGSRIVVQLNAYSPYRLWSLGETVPERIARAFPTVRVVQSHDREAFLRLLPEAVVLYTWSLPRRHFARARNLRWVHTPETGAELLLFPELVKSDVLVTNSGAVSAEAAADHAWGLLLMLSRRLAICIEAQRSRLWARDRLWSGDVVPFSLEDRTIVIVGLGAIGRAVARRAKASGMSVIGVRRHQRNDVPDGVDEVHTHEALAEVLPRAEAIAACLPLTPATRRVFGAACFARCKPGCLFVNVGRGELVDDDALIEALESGRLGGAGLDVFSNEPLARDHPLWSHPRVVLTPHVAGTDPRYMERVTELFERNLARFIEGQPLLDVIDKKAGY
ncbi:MAG: D-2-hydroxyacid dehydrogenase [Acidobacteriota bacterium]|nr:MAG: D-2-hydroxyacid dehydrogenase [Acidobacteriota bacterium]